METGNYLFLPLNVVFSCAHLLLFLEGMDFQQFIKLVDFKHHEAMNQLSKDQTRLEHVRPADWLSFP